jgi:hypothetical protein
MGEFHKFKLGQHVNLLRFVTSLRPPLGKFEIIRLMPAEHGVCQYRIRSLLDRHERMVTEMEIELA